MQISIAITAVTQQIIADSSEIILTPPPWHSHLAKFHTSAQRIGLFPIGYFKIHVLCTGHARVSRIPRRTDTEITGANTYVLTSRIDHKYFKYMSITHRKIYGVSSMRRIAFISNKDEPTSNQLTWTHPRTYHISRKTSSQSRTSSHKPGRKSNRNLFAVNTKAPTLRNGLCI
jgi:hypothetical protein